WQMSAIEEYESTDKGNFYSKIFHFLSVIMFVSISLLLLSLKLIMSFLVADNYFDAWKYVPFLLLAAIFSCFSRFLVTNYIAAKKTSGVFKTTVIGAALNIILNILLVPTIGINGAAIGTMVSFLII